MNLKRVGISLLIAAIVPVIFWIGGLDFHRGAWSAYCFGLTIFVFIAAFTYPGWNKDK